jgi:hypothetical protein
MHAHAINLSANDSYEFKYGVSDSETTGKRLEMANGLEILKNSEYLTN